MFENRRYVIVPTGSFTDEMISRSIEGSVNKLRYSVSGSEAIVRYNLVDESSYVDTLSGSGYEIYNQDEILNIVTSSVWHKELVI